LVESFDSFAIAEGDWLPEDEGVHAGTVKIDPSLRPEVARALLAAQGWPAAGSYMEPAPPLAWIEAVGAVGISGNTQEFDHFRLARVRPRTDAPGGSI